MRARKVNHSSTWCLSLDDAAHLGAEDDIGREGTLGQILVLLSTLCLVTLANGQRLTVLTEAQGGNISLLLGGIALLIVFRHVHILFLISVGHILPLGRDLF